jgi:hypothetical protein
MVYEGTKQVERNNAEVKREFGDRYDESKAAPWWHAIIITILVFVLTPVLVATLATLAEEIGR